MIQNTLSQNNNQSFERKSSLPPYRNEVIGQTLSDTTDQRSSVPFQSKRLHHDPRLPVNIGVIHTHKPAFLTLQSASGGSRVSLYISSFDMMGLHSVKSIHHINDKLTNFRDLRARVLTRNIVWPNGVREVPSELFGKPGVLVSGGFLHPLFSTGNITFVPLDSLEKQLSITKPKKGWFYHKTELIDLNGDGRPDILTARANKPVIGKAKGELLWLENPGTPHGEWKEHIIANGPDVHFEILYLPHQKGPVIVCSEFFNKRMSITWKEEDGFRTRVIDDTLGHGFDLQIVDLNNDGRPELLVTNHENPKGSVFMYEIPEDIKCGEWKRTTLYSEIKTELKGPFQASPGTAIAFHPTKDTTKKPHIVVSGDGSTKAHLLIPKSEDPRDCSYDHHVLVHTGCTIGRIAVSDVNHDGVSEIFIPAYEKNQIYVFSYPHLKT